MESTYVENVQQSRDEEEPLSVPTYNFMRRDGNDLTSDDRNDDGRMPGDPGLPPFVDSVSAVGVTGRRNSGSGDMLDSTGNDGQTPGDPHAVLHPAKPTSKRGRVPAPSDASNYQEGQTAICPECGYSFVATVEKPLLLPTMPITNRKKPYLPKTTDDAGDDGTMPDSVPVMNCPRCGASL